MNGKIGFILLAVALLAAPIGVRAQGSGVAAPNSTSRNATTGRSAIPADQTPTTQSGAPECGVAAETDTGPNAKQPCNPKNVVPKAAR